MTRFRLYLEDARDSRGVQSHTRARTSVFVAFSDTWMPFG